MNIDPELLERGKQKVQSARKDMLGLIQAINDPKTRGALRGKTMIACITPSPQTGVFFEALHAISANIVACSDNMYAADDDVIGYLKSLGVKIFAKSNMTTDEYFQAMEDTLTTVKDDRDILLMDDGCDITSYIIEKHPEMLGQIRGISEQTTCGINFLKSHYKNQDLSVPSIDINHSFTKQWFDNHLGIQQSIVHAFSKCGVTITGKHITVFGYGPVGKGAATALKAHGANVSIVEKDITLLMQAQLEGFIPVDTRTALASSDICISATGCVDTIKGISIEKYARNGLILVNIGHGNAEYDIEYLENHGKKVVFNKYTDLFIQGDGREIYSLCGGALLNFIAGGGNPSTFMSLTFTLTVLAQAEIARGRLDTAAPGIYPIFEGIEKASVEFNYPHLVPLVYALDEEQKAYLHDD